MTLSTEQLATLVRGATLYHRLAPGAPQGEGEAAFYFDRNGRAAARLPNGTLMRGSYVVENGAYRMDWDGGLQNSRSTLTQEADGTYACRNAADGTLRSIVTRVRDGDTETLGEGE